MEYIKCKFSSFSIQQQQLRSRIAVLPFSVQSPSLQQSCNCYADNNQQYPCKPEPSFARNRHSCSVSVTSSSPPSLIISEPPSPEHRQHLLVRFQNHEPLWLLPRTRYDNTTSIDSRRPHITHLHDSNLQQLVNIVGLLLLQPRATLFRLQRAAAATFQATVLFTSEPNSATTHTGS